MGVLTAVRWSRTLSILAAPALAFAAFVCGLASTSLVMPLWNSDAVFFLCFVPAFLAGFLVSNRVTASLSGDGIPNRGLLSTAATLVYLASAGILSLILVGIIHDLRSP